MIVAFFLVAVPPMMFSAYIAAKLLSEAFDRNVQQWLTETANFISTEVEELIVDAEHAAIVLGDKLHQSQSNDPFSNLSGDIALLSSMGVDVVAVYDESNTLVYSSIPIESLFPLPNESSRSLFKVKSNSTSQLAAGAIHTYTSDGKLKRIFIGYWLIDTLAAASKAITSLEFEVFRNDGDSFTPMLPKEERRLNIPPNEYVLRALSTSSKPVAGDENNKSIYRTVYLGLKASNGKLLGVAFIGLATHRSIFEQLGRRNLFSEMFLVGSSLSILAGLFISGLLVKPLRALTNGVRSISRGDLKHRVIGGGGAELEELATSFNEMASELERLRSIEADARNREKILTLAEAAVVIAHEVRNPLGIIKTSSELVRVRAKLAPDEDRVLGYVTDEVNRIERLIRNFLDFAKPTPPVLRKIKVHAIIDRISEIVGPEFEKRRIIFEIEDDPTSLEINADQDQVYQVCLNLILNSMEAMSAGGKITADVQTTTNEVVLCISDNGPGISDDVALKIFEPFYTTKATGTGLGLAKAQSIMNAHGGWLFFSPIKDGGAQFNLVFPKL